MMRFNWDNQIINIFPSKQKLLAKILRRHEAWEPRVTEIFLKLLKPGMTVVDVGACCGYYTLLAARRIGQTGKVFAFEPREWPAELLKESVEANHYQNVSIIPLALFSERKRFYIGHTMRVRNEAQNGDEEVLAIRFDDFVTQEGLTKLDLVKIDVEGAEYGVLEGMEKSLERWRPILLIEIHRKMLRAFFSKSEEGLLVLIQSHGYTFERIDGTHILARHLACEENKLASPPVERALNKKGI